MRKKIVDLKIGFLRIFSGIFIEIGLCTQSQNLEFCARMHKYIFNYYSTLCTDLMTLTSIKWMSVSNKICFDYDKNSLIIIVNKSTNINKTNYHISPQLI